MPQIIAFLGASGGCGHAALVAALAAGHTCIALCRVPSKLDDLAAQYPETLIVKAGNAHNVADVVPCLVHDGSLVHAISFSIGNKPDMQSMKFADPQVCQKGMKTLLEALATLRRDWALEGNPLVCAISTTGISNERDVPLLFVPFYRFVLATPHADKKVMEDILTASSERFVFVRPSLLVDGDSADKKIRIGVEDVRAGKLESKEVGYTISRDAVGRWIFHNLLDRAEQDSGYEGKAVTLTW
ncbi:hypothetical protein ACRE_030160 [Hapsidospora chrysogenum ATCC 11550]|uniref:NAD(P)-binding domain-containing protein n=1 Tax=Hapsidospora chrysogenum (strain ATCC 11550 / CBS 779.69 / DSM 880 / IAM 14645 / JCM 23072 / IMI 49137) TaxID=857340 RepID=A0A086T9W7_HAPC1|nr:hypothetical protein ACRE_030160 [Hapsidospora chrysogenum ATCC 11550]